MFLAQYMIAEVLSLFLGQFRNFLEFRLGTSMFDLVAPVFDQHFFASLAMYGFRLNYTTNLPIVLMLKVHVSHLKHTVTSGFSHSQVHMVSCGVLIGDLFLARHISTHPLQILVLVFHEWGQASLIFYNSCLLVRKVLYLAEFCFIEQTWLHPIALKLTLRFVFVQRMLNIVEWLN